MNHESNNQPVIEHDDRKAAKKRRLKLPILKRLKTGSHKKLKLLAGVLMVAGVGLIVFGFWQLNNQEGVRHDGTIIIGDTKITKADIAAYAAEVEKFKQEYPQAELPGAPRDIAIDDLVLNAAFKKEAKELKDPLTDEDVINGSAKEFSNEDEEQDYLYRLHNGTKMNLVRAENVAYEQKFDSKLLKKKDLLVVSVSFDTPYHHRAAEKDIQRIYDEGSKMLADEIMPLMAKDATKEEIAAKADVVAFDDNQEDDADFQQYYDGLVLFTDVKQNYTEDETIFNDLEDSEFNYVRGDGDVGDLQDTDDMVAKLEKVGDNTGVFASKTGNHMIIRLEDTTDGKYISWAEMLKQYKDKYVAGTSNQKKLGFVVNMKQAIDTSLGATSLTLTSIGLQKASAQVPPGGCSAHNVKFIMLAYDVTTNTYIAGAEMRHQRDSHNCGNQYEGTKTATSTNGRSANSTNSINDNCYGPEPNWDIIGHPDLSDYDKVPGGPYSPSYSSTPNPSNGGVKLRSGPSSSANSSKNYAGFPDWNSQDINSTGTIYTIAFYESQEGGTCTNCNNGDYGVTFAPTCDLLAGTAFARTSSGAIASKIVDYKIFLYPGASYSGTPGQLTARKATAGNHSFADGGTLLNGQTVGNLFGDGSTRKYFLIRVYDGTETRDFHRSRVRGCAPSLNLFTGVNTSPANYQTSVPAEQGQTVYFTSLVHNDSNVTSNSNFVRNRNYAGQYGNQGLTLAPDQLWGTSANAYAIPANAGSGQQFCESATATENGWGTVFSSNTACAVTVTGKSSVSTSASPDMIEPTESATLYATINTSSFYAYGSWTGYTPSCSYSITSQPPSGAAATVASGSCSQFVGGNGAVQGAAHVYTPPAGTPIGSRICITANLDAGNRNLLAAGGPTSSTSCLRVIARPYFKALGSDVAVGQAFAGGSCNTGAKVVGWNKNSGGTNYAGAGAQYAVFAQDQIRYFAAGQGLTQDGSRYGNAPSRLAFTNDAANQPIGLYGGNFNGMNCSMQDYFGSIPATTLAWSSISSANGQSTPTDPNPAFNATGPLRLEGVTEDSSNVVRNGSNIKLYVDGDVFITSNIIAESGATSVAQVPGFTLIAQGNIYIDPSVTDLYGTYIAQPNSGSGGNIYTCATAVGTSFSPASPITDPTVNHNRCANRLTVVGSFVAKQVHLFRTNGSLYRDTGNHTFPGGTSHTNAAEVFLYNPLVWMRQSTSSSSSSDTTYDSITTLPPVL